MLRCLRVLAILGWAVLAFSAGCMAAEEIIDPEKAKADPDFTVQGEYVGEFAGDGVRYKGAARIAAQVVALGDGKFDVYVLAGGLPGAGWKRDDARIRVEGQRSGEQTAVRGEEFEGVISGGEMTLSAKGTGKASLKQVARKSPTLGAKPPEGAVVLFGETEGKENWNNAHISALGHLMGDSASKAKFGDCTIHMEFMLSYMPKARGQGRSNSGVYLHDCYECQVLDSFGLTGENNECGGFYTLKAPSVNMCLPPLVWQTYDFELTAPKYDAEGKKIANAKVTARHNGVAIHDALELPKFCPGRQQEGPAPRPLFLQGHGNKVQYRNIWVLERRN